MIFSTQYSVVNQRDKSYVCTGNGHPAYLLYPARPDMAARRTPVFGYRKLKSGYPKRICEILGYRYPAQSVSGSGLSSFLIRGQKSVDKHDLTNLKKPKESFGFEYKNLL